MQNINQCYRGYKQTHIFASVKIHVEMFFFFFFFFFFNVDLLLGLHLQFLLYCSRTINAVQQNFNSYDAISFMSGSRHRKKKTYFEKKNNPYLNPQGFFPAVFKRSYLGIQEVGATHPTPKNTFLFYFVLFGLDFFFFFFVLFCFVLFCFDFCFVLFLFFPLFL